MGESTDSGDRSADGSSLFYCRKNRAPQGCFGRKAEGARRSKRQGNTDHHDCKRSVFTVLQCVVLYTAGHEASAKSSVESVELNRILTICTGIMFLVLGNYLPKAKLNSMVGFRCGWSMYNDMTWQKCNRFAGYALMLAGLATVLCAIALPKAWTIASMLVLLTVALIFCLFYAAKVYREEKAKG